MSRRCWSIIAASLFYVFIAVCQQCLAGQRTLAEFERTTGINEIPDQFFVLYYKQPPPQYTFDYLKRTEPTKAQIRSWDILYRPDGTKFRFTRMSDLRHFFSQDANKLLENNFLSADSAEEEPFADDSNNVHYKLLARGKMKLGGRDAAWAKVSLIRKDKSTATALAIVCPLKDKDEEEQIYALTAAPEFNMKAAQMLFSAMKL